ncbi:alpha/beta hydrolase family protein [Paenibacillus arenosi]|uniref:Dienelactone hydrolase family protein n=1 Tax=Paenibacillus arenosi TaxID=2774142 RepID=A0ABR9B0Q9_9BACL|nr:dienelactone hydrolase family protein [Paenibacillus arenosi]MBD8498771.1 dienelactone hydrolase family protein [Paenibacillus arenosi]
MKSKMTMERKNILLLLTLLCSLFAFNSASQALGNDDSKQSVATAEASASITAATAVDTTTATFKPMSHSTAKTTTVQFPSLTGPYQVGTETFHWIDKTRPERFTATKNDHRELMIQVWYPTKATSTIYKRQPFSDDPTAHARAFESYAQVPASKSMPLFLSTTHSLIKAPIAENKQKYPVLIFSHGFGARNDSYRFLTEQLASQGYIVVSVQHTYNSFLTQFPTGKVAPYVGSKIENYAYMDRLMTNVWVKDIQSVLDRLEQLSEKQSYPIWKQLDLKRIGMLGHSFGGAASAQVMLADKRVKAGINMDGSFYGKVIPDTGIPGPFLYMGANDADGLQNMENIDPKELAAEHGVRVEEVKELLSYSSKRYKQALRHSYSLSFEHANHETFCDFPILMEQFGQMKASSLNSVSRHHRIINEYALEFFDHVLKGKRTTLLSENKNKYEGVTLTIGEGLKEK